MAAYVLYEATIPDIAKMAEYIERMPDILARFGGRYLVRAGATDVKEGTLGEHPIKVVLEFPDMERANAWYHSDAYRELMPQRTKNATGNLVFVEGI